jgi:hypothetical protein
MTSPVLGPTATPTTVQVPEDVPAWPMRQTQLPEAEELPAEEAVAAD